jgi:VanZ family protein
MLRWIWRWLLVATWGGVVLAIGSSTLIPMRDGDTFRWMVRKGIHASEYAVLGGLLYYALGCHARRFRLALALLALLLAVSVGGLDEWRQTFIPGRSGRLLDVGIDAMGAGIGLLLIVVWAQTSWLWRRAGGILRSRRWVE